METMTTLLTQNTIFHSKYGLKPYDLAKVNNIIESIESTRGKVPVAGDRIICKGPKKTYEKGHLELTYTEKFSSICVQPYIPFVFIHRNDDGTIDPWFNTSGGYWISCIEREMYKYVGTCMKTFQTFGHCGPCESGVVKFTAEINKWEIYREDIY